MIPPSKSIINRFLIINSYEPEFLFQSNTQADDVVKMKSALADFSKGELADCGSAGTTLRFMAMRVSRRAGSHHLRGSLRLFERPHNEIVSILHQLGCEAELRLQRLTIRGRGWQVPESGLVIDRTQSSQFASALLLNSWGLPKPLKISFGGGEEDAVSNGYFSMTLAVVKQAGMCFLSESPNEIVVAPECRVKAQFAEAEPDLSSAFAVAALAAVSGKAEILDFPKSSLQPDVAFVEILEQMGCQIQRTESSLFVEMPESHLRAISCDLNNSPDLFPVLAVLCALAKGTSRLHGAPHLEHKESARITKSAELVRLMGRKVRPIDGGLEIDGVERSERDLRTSSGAAPARPGIQSFNPDHDHRLAMAAAVARAAGAAIDILHPEVVNKSFPTFWEIEGSRKCEP
jgi:3-phosphoshikimate 1-carboxyvinyltransferase